MFPTSRVEIREDSWREGLLPAPGRAGILQPARASCLPWQEAVFGKVPLMPLWTHPWVGRVDVLNPTVRTEQACPILPKEDEGSFACLVRFLCGSQET